MFQSKKFNLILSFVLACALWFYVVGQLNPTTKKTYRYIPIMMTNIQSLNDNGLDVVRISDDSLRVTVSAKRDVISKISKSDIVATVDLTDAAEGKNVLPIDLKIPEDVEIDNQSINEVTVMVEERVTKTKDVRVSFTGSYADGEEPAAVKVDPETVQVSGARSLVDKVSYVKAEVEARYVSKELGSTTCTLTAVTSGGNEVRDVSLSETKCKVTSIIYQKKNVKLVVPVKDDSNDRYTRVTSAPDKIAVKGPSDMLSGIDEISAEEIDITDIRQNKKIDITPKLPAGIQLSGTSKDLKLTVKVTKAKKGSSGKTVNHSKDKDVKVYNFTDDDVNIRNNRNNQYKINYESIEVQVTGTEEQLSAITSSDIVLYVDAEGLETDEAELTVNVECKKAYSDIAVIPSVIKVVTE